MIPPKIARVSLSLLIMVSLGSVFFYRGDLSCVTERSEDTVRGASMQPLIKDGATITALYGFYACNQIRRGDLALISPSANRDPLIKKVRVLPGDRFGLFRVGADRWNILVNGTALKNSEGQVYSLSDRGNRMISLYETDYKGVMPPGFYFIFGEDPAGTLDSTKFGPVGEQAILAKVISYSNE